MNQPKGQAPDDPSKHVADLQAVLEVSRELAATDSLAHLVRAIERAACTVLEAEGATLLLHDADREALFRPEVPGDGAAGEAHYRIAHEAVRSRRRIELDDPASDPRYDPELDAGCGVPTRNLAFFPLLDYPRENVVGVLQVRNLPPLDPWDEELIRVFDAQVGVAVQRQLLLDEYAEKQRIERDLKLARSIQQRLLPDADPSAPGFDIAGWNAPADDTGGDFWDHHQLSGGALALVLADATGHGISAALIMAACRSLLRATTSISDDLTQIVDRVNRLLYDDLIDSRSITVVLGFLDGDTLSFLSAGHGPIVRYLAATGEFRTQPAHGIPLGILPDYPWPAAERFTPSPGDLMVWLTDGFFEWENEAGEELGMKRLLEAVREHRDSPAGEIIRGMIDAVKRFVGSAPQVDDLTALVIRKL